MVTLRKAGFFLFTSFVILQTDNVNYFKCSVHIGISKFCTLNTTTSFVKLSENKNSNLSTFTVHVVRTRVIQREAEICKLC